MGLFGGQTKEEKVEPALPEEQTKSEEEPAAAPKPRNSTVIAKGITLSGALQGEGVVQVEGTVEGEIKLSGSVIVTTTGLIRGPVAADVVRIAGKVEGKITARDHLRLEKTGSVEGDVATASLVVEDGGRLNGRSTMTEAASKEPFVPEASIPLSDLQFGPNYPVGEEEDEEEKETAKS